MYPSTLFECIIVEVRSVGGMIKQCIHGRGVMEQEMWGGGYGIKHLPIHQRWRFVRKKYFFLHMSLPKKK